MPIQLGRNGLSEGAAGHKTRDAAERACLNPGATDARVAEWQTRQT